MDTNALVTVAQTLNSPDFQQQLKSVLPSQVRPDKFVTVVLTALQQNPAILEGDRQSLYSACVVLARRGLLPDKREAALVIFPTNVGTRDNPQWMKLVQAMPMVEGIIKEMAKAKINAYAVSVFENDTISLWNDDEGQHVRHEPQVFGDRGQMVGVFAAAKAEDGRTYIEAMNLKDIEQVARRSKQNFVNKQTGALEYGGTWKSDYDRMGQKSALHRLRKRLPIIDEDVLQNLKDMEEETDIILGSAATPPEGAASTPAPTQGSSSPLPPAQLASPVADPNAQVLKPPRTPRKSRVLDQVVQTAKATNGNQAVLSSSRDGEGVSAPAPKGSLPNSLGGAAEGKGQPKGTTSGVTPDTSASSRDSEPPPEYSEDDII